MNYKKRKNIIRVIMIIVALLMFVGVAMSGLVTAFAAENVTVETFESGSLYNAFNDAKEDTDQNNVKSFTVKSGVVSSADFSMFGNLSSCEIIDLSGTEFEGGKIPDNFMSGRRVSEFYAPKNINTIGNNAFSGCGNLQKLSFTNSLEMVGNRAFESCSALTSVYFPESLKLVDECAFRGSGLTDIYFYGNAPEARSEAFPTSATIHITENATGFDSDFWNKYNIVKDVVKDSSATPEETTVGAVSEETVAPIETEVSAETTVTEVTYGAYAEDTEEAEAVSGGNSDKNSAVIVIVIAAAVVIIAVVIAAAVVIVMMQKNKGENKGGYIEVSEKSDDAKEE